MNYGAARIADVPTWSGDADRWTLAADGGVVDELPPPSRGDDAHAPDRSAVDMPERVDVDDATVADDRFWTIVPLAYGRTVYGALGLRSGHEDPALTGHERKVLAELGELIGQAIDAVEARRLLAAESVVELDLHCSDADEPLVRAAAEADRLTVNGLVPDTGDGHVAYVGVEGGAAGAVAVTLADGDDATRVNRGGEGDGDGDGNQEGGLVEWTVPAETALGTLVARGAKVLEGTVEDGVARFSAEVASDADVRALVERVRAAYPDTRLESVTGHDRSVERADSVPGGDGRGPHRAPAGGHRGGVSRRLLRLAARVHCRGGRRDTRHLRADAARPPAEGRGFAARGPVRPRGRAAAGRLSAARPRSSRRRPAVASGFERALTG